MKNENYSGLRKRAPFGGRFYMLEPNCAFWEDKRILMVAATGISDGFFADSGM